MRRDVYQAIADPVRRDIIDLLSKEPLSVNEVANEFEISRPAISKQVIENLKFFRHYVAYTT